MAVHLLPRHEVLGGREPWRVKAGEVCLPEHFKLSFRVDGNYVKPTSGTVELVLSIWSLYRERL